MRLVKMSALTGVWKKLIPNFMNETLKRGSYFSERSNCRCGGTCKRTKIMSGAEDMTEFTL